MRLLLSCLFIGAFFSIGWSQEDTSAYKTETFAKNRLEFRHDNDFLLFTDRYYTTGSFIAYKRLLEKAGCESCKEQVGVQLEHVFYTPTNRESENNEDFDRPYAGFLGLSGSWVLTNKNHLIDFKLLLGVSGKSSGAEGFQNLFHNSGGIGSPVAWTDQIDNSFHFNVYSAYLKEWQLLPNPFSVHISYSPEFAIGTKDVFFKQKATFFFGKRNGLKSSMAYSQLGKLNNELFFGLHVSHSYVAHNALLEGNLAGDNSPFTIKPKDKLFQFGVDIYHRRGKNDFKFGYTYETPEAQSTVLHIFVGASYSRNF